MKPVISVCDVTFSYRKGEPIVQNATFDVFQNEFLAIIGPNGGGKTTLLKLILGFLQPDSGSITVLGKKTTHYPNEIGYVPQAMHFDKAFPIHVLDLVLGGRLSTLSFSSRFSQEDIEIAHNALELVGIKDLANRPFGMLSGGQAQRALIARALAQKPKILLLDEPMACVDPEAEAGIYDVLDTLRKEHTILMVTHDIRAVIKHVKRVLCVQGRVQTIEPSDVCEHFALGLYHFPLIETPEHHLKS